MQWRTTGLVAVCSLGLLFGGCSSTPADNVEVVDRAGSAAGYKKVTTGNYTVQPGDTLWSIAFRFGWDWHELAQQNAIVSPYVIYPKQTIYFDRPLVASPESTAPTMVSATETAVAASSTSAVPATRVDPVSSSRPSATAEPVTQVSSPAVKASGAAWIWPARGEIISRYASNGSLNKGIDIAGQLGDPVLAASGGTVVYAGSGLRGYGELVIVKHNDIFVSAYGHNRKLLVREGQQVTAGQTIAEMGSTGTDRVKLHFEIRRQGKPVDPEQYLPAR